MKTQIAEQGISVAPRQAGFPTYSIQDVAAIEARARAMRAVWFRDKIRQFMHRDEAPVMAPALGQAV